MEEPKMALKISKKKVADAKKTKVKQQSKKGKNEDVSRVIYMGHIPPAFEEPEILQFLSQFGKVTNVKLSRSRRTGNPRGYAFVEFAEKEVAIIVAETMSGYFLMGERRLVCHIVPQDKIHPELFRGAKANLAHAQAGRRSSESLKILHYDQMKKVNATKSVEQLSKITKRLLSRDKKKREQLKSLGIDYDFPGYTAHSSANDEKASGRKRKVSVDGDEAMEDVAVDTPKAKKSRTPKKNQNSAVVELEDKVMKDVAVKASKTKKAINTPKKAASKKETNVAVEAEAAEDEPMEDVAVKTPKAKKGRTPKKSVNKKPKTAAVEVEATKVEDKLMKDVAVKASKAKKAINTPKKAASKKQTNVAVEADAVEDEPMEDVAVKTPKAKKGKTPKKAAVEVDKRSPKLRACKTPKKSANVKTTIEDVETELVETPAKSKVTAKKAETEVQKRKTRSSKKSRQSLS
jgi:nucleolar protein 15